MRLLFLLCIAAVLFSCKSTDKKRKSEGGDTMAISPVALAAEQLPASIKVKGKLQEAWQWTDKSGENILLTSYTQAYQDTGKNEYGEEGQTAELHAAQYVKKGEGYELVWNSDDKVKACPFDITCEFVKDATTVTDLDKDGIPEVTLLSRLACRSDVSASDMKLIMYEGSSKYSLTGYSWIRYSPEDSCTITEANANLETLAGYKKEDDGSFLKAFGRYESENGFSSASPEFLPYARQQWVKFIKELTE